MCLYEIELSARQILELYNGRDYISLLFAGSLAYVVTAVA
jgi:hypothetical protein